MTGAAGFIGSRLARTILQDGHEVWGTIRPGDSIRRLADLQGKVQLEAIDLADPSGVGDLLSRVRPECCIHLAWYVVPGKFWDSPENLRCVSMSLGLAQELAEVGCRRLVGIGSCTEYDWDYELLSEATTPLRPRTLYGTCKNATRQVLEVLTRQSGMSFAWARYFYLYGPGEKPQRLVPAVIRSMLRGEPAKLNSGTHVRDFMHVQDVAAATWEVAKSGLTGPVNIASGNAVRTSDIVKALAHIVGGNPQVHWGAIPDGPQDVPALRADVRRLMELASWKPAFTLEQGLQDTVAWWKEYLAEGA